MFHWNKKKNPYSQFQMYFKVNEHKSFIPGFSSREKIPLWEHICNNNICWSGDRIVSLLWYRTQCLCILSHIQFLMWFFPLFYNPRLTGREPLVFLPAPFSNEAPSGKAHLKQCEQMTLTRRQKRLCRREPGLAETLRESVRLSLLECRYQFRNERWNCSLDGRGSLLKRGEPL